MGPSKLPFTTKAFMPAVPCLVHPYLTHAHALRHASASGLPGDCTHATAHFLWKPALPGVSNSVSASVTGVGAVDGLLGPGPGRDGDAHASAARKRVRSSANALACHPHNTMHAKESPQKKMDMKRCRAQRETAENTSGKQNRFTKRAPQARHAPGQRLFWVHSTVQ